jgi:hypothetical protein
VKNLWLIPVLAMLAILVVGCNQQLDSSPVGVPPVAPVTTLPTAGPNWFPENDPNFRQLTDSEKQNVVDIALKDPEISNWLQGRIDFRASGMQWYAIILVDLKPGSWWALDYMQALTQGVPSYVPKSAKLYPGVTIAIGEGTITQAQIAVDLETEKAVMIDGPYPSLSSPDRFKSLTPSK